MVIRGVQIASVEAIMAAVGTSMNSRRTAPPALLTVWRQWIGSDTTAGAALPEQSSLLLLQILLN